MVCLLASILLAAQRLAEPTSLQAVPDVVDGDSLVFNIRLRGIDAPEYDQQCKTAAGECYPCGEKSMRSLQALLRGSTNETGAGEGHVSCLFHEMDRYGRAIMSCDLLGGRSLAEGMVRQGQAILAPKYIQSPTRLKRYRAAQAEAKQHRRGLWQGSFDTPAQWRSGQRLCPASEGRQLNPDAIAP